MYGMTPDWDGVYRNWHVTPWGTHRLTSGCQKEPISECKPAVHPDANEADDAGRGNFWRWVAIYALKQMRKEAGR